MSVGVEDSKGQSMLRDGIVQGGTESMHVCIETETDNTSKCPLQFGSTVLLAYSPASEI